METQTYTGTLVVQTCCNCSMQFGMDRSFDNDRRNDHESWYCPAGHKQYYPQESDEEIYKRQRDASRVECRRAEAREELAKRSLTATKGHLTRQKNRIASGACPCCDKHFKVLKKHMARMHPDYAESEDQP